MSTGVPPEAEERIRRDERAKILAQLTGEAGDEQESLTIEAIRAMSGAQYLQRKQEVDDYLATHGYEPTATGDAA